MHQTECTLAFFDKATEQMALVVQFRGQYLEGDNAIIARVTGAINDRHAATPDFSFDAIAVGQRVARLLLPQGANVILASRDIGKAQDTCDRLRKRSHADGSTKLQPLSVEDPSALARALESSVALFSCGAAGVRLVSAQQLESARHLRVAIDLNAVPPEGIEGISAMDKGVERGQRFDYGAIGVGGLKMKIHREAVRTLFTRNDLVLDAEEIFEIGQGLLPAK